MEEKKEVQASISPEEANEKVSEDEMFNVLRTVAPGTQFRSGLDGALKSGKGALIVMENESLLPIMDSGFRVNCRFTPQRLIELAKMDGAIVLSKDLKRINYANVLLTPDSKIRSAETGARHKTAERTAKQTRSLVIAISERKHVINIFYKNVRHHLKSTDEILRKANEHLQLLEKQRELFDANIDKLNKLELRNYPSLHQAVHVIQKGKFIEKIASDLKKYIVELGNESLLIKARMKELANGIERELSLVIKDYTKVDVTKSKASLSDLSYEELLENDNILSSLGYEGDYLIEPIKGWRILSKTSLPEADIAKLIKERGSLGDAIHSNMRSYMELIGEDKAKAFKDEIEKIKLNPWQLKQ